MGIVGRGVVWYGMAWCGVAWHGTVVSEHSKMPGYEVRCSVAW